MSNKEKLIGVFVSALGIAAEVAESAVFKETPGWDSVGHVNLMNEIEETFDVSLEPDDILDFKSFEIGKGLLNYAHDVFINLLNGLHLVMEISLMAHLIWCLYMYINKVIFILCKCLYSGISLTLIISMQTTVSAIYFYNCHACSDSNTLKKINR